MEAKCHLHSGTQKQLTISLPLSLSLYIYIYIYMLYNTLWVYKLRCLQNVLLVRFLPRPPPTPAVHFHSLHFPYSNVWSAGASATPLITFNSSICTWTLYLNIICVLWLYIIARSKVLSGWDYLQGKPKVSISRGNEHYYAYPFICIHQKWSSMVESILKTLNQIRIWHSWGTPFNTSHVIYLKCKCVCLWPMYGHFWSTLYIIPALVCHVSVFM